LPQVILARLSPAARRIVWHCRFDNRTVIFMQKICMNEDGLKYGGAVRSAAPQSAF
jgi:hypothetical protein